MARMVATKAALSIRVDALTDADGKSEPTAPTIGLENRAKLESRLRALEHQGDIAGARGFSTPGKKQQKFAMNGETKVYNTAADSVGLVSTQRDPVERALQTVADVKEEKRKAKEERRAKRRAEKEKEDPSAIGLEGLEIKHDATVEANGATSDKSSKKEKKRKRRESDMDVAADNTVGASFLHVGSYLLSLSLSSYRLLLKKLRRRGRPGRRQRKQRRRRRRSRQMVWHRIRMAMRRRRREERVKSSSSGRIGPHIFYHNFVIICSICLLSSLYNSLEQKPGDRCIHDCIRHEHPYFRE